MASGPSWTTTRSAPMLSAKVLLMEPGETVAVLSAISKSSADESTPGAAASSAARWRSQSESMTLPTGM
jgi:hypothetical protein